MSSNKRLQRLKGQLCNGNAMIYCLQMLTFLIANKHKHFLVCMLRNAEIKAHKKPPPKIKSNLKKQGETD